MWVMQWQTLGKTDASSGVEKKYIYWVCMGELQDPKAVLESGKWLLSRTIDKT